MKPSTSLADIKEYSLSYHEDYRGEIFTTYKDSLEGRKFDHDKICIRPQNCLVGIHGDYNTWKLITCLYGNVYCVLVDKRPESDDLNKHKTFILNNKNKKQLLLPPGIGNSFLVLSESCVYNYKLSYVGEYVDCDDQFTLRWNDPLYGIDWPIENPILSPRDKLISNE